MNAEEFVKQEIAVRSKVHFNDGIWWGKRSSFFYRPINFLHKFMPGKATPKITRSFLGYSHLVNEAQYANNYWAAMILRSDKLKDFSLQNISANKRKRIRKGLRLTEVKKITNIEEVINDIQKICISMANRTRHGLPAEYYVKQYHKWKSFMTKEFNLPNREWWGAYYDGILVAYRYDVLIDNAMCFLATKSHSEHLDKCPNDALMFTFIEYCKSLEDCIELNAGDWNESRQTINRFKELFGFERVDLPMYTKYNPLVIFSKRVNELRKSTKLAVD